MDVSLTDCFEGTVKLHLLQFTSPDQYCKTFCCKITANFDAKFEAQDELAHDNLYHQDEKVCTNPN